MGRVGASQQIPLSAPYHRIFGTYIFSTSVLSKEENKILCTFATKVISALYQDAFLLL